MTKWTKCTDIKSGDAVYVNLEGAMSLTPGKKGGTIIAFPGDKNDYVAVKEPIEELIGKKCGSGKSCPCGSATEHPAE